MLLFYILVLNFIYSFGGLIAHIYSIALVYISSLIMVSLEVKMYTTSLGGRRRQKNDVEPMPSTLKQILKGLFSNTL